MELNVNHCGTNYFLRFSLLVIERKMKKKYMILLSALSLASSTFAQTWIWNVVLFFLLFGKRTVIMLS